jgi:hypothetical protein
MDQARRELIEMLARAAYEAIVAARQNAPAATPGADRAQVAP